MMIRTFKEHKISIPLLLLTGLFYAAFAYDLERTDFIKLISIYTGLIFLSWQILHLEKFNSRFLLGAAILFRLIFLFSLPGLSQDFYRFLWDGKLLLQGINPYLFTPAELTEVGQNPVSNGQELIAGMGSLSAGNYTNYPPLNQLIFAMAALAGEKSITVAVLVLRIFIVSADLGIYYFGKKLLKKLDLPGNRIFWYLLNPLIIIELTGNLHFEGVMLFFLVAALYFLHQRKWLLSALLLGCSVSVKLIPLLFLPLFFRKLGMRKALAYYAATGLLCLLLFLPFLSEEFLRNYRESVGLWFQSFEFNASIYYLIRWIGYRVQGYNIIGTAGPLLGLLVFLFVLFMSFLRRNQDFIGLLTSMLFAISGYLFLATTIHPWYLTTPLVLSVFTRYKFVLVWSFVVMVSYSAYSQPDFKENLWLVALEYMVVFGVLGYEIFQKKKKPGHTKFMDPVIG